MPHNDYFSYEWNEWCHQIIDHLHTPRSKRGIYGFISPSATEMPSFHLSLIRNALIRNLYETHLHHNISFEHSLCRLNLSKACMSDITLSCNVQILYYPWNMHAVLLFLLIESRAVLLSSCHVLLTHTLCGCCTSAGNIVWQWSNPKRYRQKHECCT